MSELGSRLQSALAPRYADLVEVASGGMGTVFRARDTELGRDVAVKVLAPELATAAGVERFRREARTLARLSHPHIVPVYDEAAAGGLFLYYMEYLGGETLRDRMARGPLDAASVTTLADQLLGALERVHREGIVHRDIKPANIFLTDGRAVLTDFGVARWTDADASVHTRPGDRPGSPAYMAPEQLAGREAVPRSDLYSLALVLYEAAAGRRWDDPDRPRSARWQGVSRPLARALSRALEHDVSARWPDAAAFRAALRRRRWAPYAVAAGVVAVAGVAVLASTLRPTAPAPVPAADLMLLPFEHDDSAALGRQIARFAGMHLEWYPRWRVVPALHGVAAWDAARRRGVTPAWFDQAQYEVRGGLLQRETGWELVLTVHADSGRRLHETITVPGSPDDPLGWGRAAAESLVVRLFPQHAPEFGELAARSSRSVQAVAAYLAGSDAFSADRLTDADAHYGQALRLDPAFAQAAWQRLVVRRWMREETADELRELHERHATELPALYRSLTAAQLEPDLRLRAARLAAVADSFPARGTAHLIAADELFHRGPLAGVPLDSALTRLAAAAAHDAQTDDVTSYEAAWGYISLGRRSEAAHELRRVGALGAARGDAALHSALMNLAFDARFAPWRAAVKLAWLRLRADSATRTAVAKHVRLGLFVGVPELQGDLGRLLTVATAAPDQRRQGWMARAAASLATGRWQDGLAQLDSAGAGDPSLALELQRAEWRVVPPLLGLPSPPAGEREAALVVLRRLADDAPASLAYRARWALAFDALLGGDSTRYAAEHAVLHAAAAASTGAGSAPDAGAARFDLLLHGYRAAREGRLSDAVAATEPLFRTDSAGMIGGPFGRAAFYLGRGEWLLAAGDAPAAERAWHWHQNSDFRGWPSGALQSAEVDQIFGAYARLRIAEAARRQGDSARACALLDEASRLWRRAEHEVLPLLAAAGAEQCR